MAMASIDTDIRLCRERFHEAVARGDNQGAEHWDRVLREMIQQYHTAQIHYDPVSNRRINIPAFKEPMPVPPDHPTTLRKNVLMRLRVDKLPFKWWEAHKVNDNLVALFIVHNEKALIVEDDWAMFPSDQLISQLRLLVG